jgi:hypothetical protein
VTDSKEWREAKPPTGEPGPIYGFRRGYKVYDAGVHENADQYAVFQQFLHMSGSRTITGLSQLTGYGCTALTNWSEKFNWQKRAAAWDKGQMAIVWKESERIGRNRHKEAILEFRQNSERQAKMMAEVSEGLLKILNKRIVDAEENGEQIPMHLVSGLLRSAANIQEQSRQSWATSLGINEMLEMIDQEVQSVDVQVIEDVNPYQITIDE